MRPGTAIVLMVGLAGLAVGVAASACDRARKPPDTSQPPVSRPEPAPGAVILATDSIEVVHEAAYSAISDRRRLVIRTQSEWEAFWRELTANELPPPPAPQIDLDRRVVIAATMGSRPTGGYAISIERVSWAEGELGVAVMEVSPAPNCILTQAFTAPVTVISVAKREGEATFVERTETRSC